MKREFDTVELELLAAAITAAEEDGNPFARLAAYAILGAKPKHRKGWSPVRKPDDKS